MTDARTPPAEDASQPSRPRPLRLGRRRVTSRLLLFWTAERARAEAFVPAPFAPLTIGGRALVVLAYTRLSGHGGRWITRQFGTPADQLAYRIPVLLTPGKDGAADTRRGSWVPRRATSSWIEARIGERFLGGTYLRSQFQLSENESELNLAVLDDEREELSLRAELGGHFGAGALFRSAREVEELLRSTGRVHPADRLAPEADELLSPTAPQMAMEPLLIHAVHAPWLEAAGPLGGATTFDSAYRLVARKAVPVRTSRDVRDRLVDPYFGKAGLTTG